MSIKDTIVFAFFFIYVGGGLAPLALINWVPTQIPRIVTRGLTIHYTAHTLNIYHRTVVWNFWRDNPTIVSHMRVGKYCHYHDGICVVIIWYVVTHTCHGRERESNPGLTADNTQYSPLHHASMLRPIRYIISLILDGSLRQGGQQPYLDKTDQ